jgi:hypothetical protein
MAPSILLLILRMLIAIALYAFLIILLRFLWLDLRSHREGVSQPPPAYLLTLEGVELEPAYPLEAVNLLGRAGDNTITLNDPTVSAYHARLSYQNRQWWLEDLGSRNGTQVNEIFVTEPLVVTYGDEIRFGQVRMQFLSGAFSAEKEDIGTQGN